MLYAVSILNSINFAPDSVAAEVVQNVQTILATVKGSVPLDRDLVSIGVLLMSRYRRQ